MWLPLVLPHYFAYCSQLASPTRALVDEDKDGYDEADHVGAAAVTPAETNSNDCAEEQGPQLTPIAASAELQKRGGAGAKATQAATTATSAAAATTIASPTPLRPLPPQQFRLRLQPGTVFASPSASPKKGSGSGSESRPCSPLDALLNSPRPAHRLLVDPSRGGGGSGGAVLASWKDPASGRHLTVNPFHIYLVEIPTKFATYFAVGFNAVLTCPRIFHWLGL